MCYVIITTRSLLWTLLSIASFMMLLAAVTSPQWLLGYSRERGLTAVGVGGPPRLHPNSSSSSSSSSSSYETAPAEEDGQEESRYQPTLGLFNRCLKLMHSQLLMSSWQQQRENCASFVTDFLMPDEEFPDAWKASLVFFGLAGVLLVVTCIAAVLSICVQTVCGKSIFTVSGLLQSIAGLLCILALVIYPAGWGSEKVKGYCGQYAGPFDMDRCQLGWSFILCVVGTVLTFLCAVLSVPADTATSSHKVEQHIIAGDNLICVL